MIGDNIRSSRNMTDVSSEFSHIGEMTGLSWRTVNRAGNGTAQRLVVCPSSKRSSFQMMTEVADAKIKSQKLFIESTIFLLSRRELLREETKRVLRDSLG